MTTSFCVNLLCFIKKINDAASQWLLAGCSFVLRASKTHLLSSIVDFSLFLLLFVIVG